MDTEEPSPLVRFVIGGVQKAGTTALASYLATHPEIRLPSGKEAHVFDAPDFDDGWTISEVNARYEPHFLPPDPGAVHGDATPIYILHPRLVERIARYNSRMRWIVLLRDPVDRAISQYHMERSRGMERLPLWAAMLLEPWRLRGHYDDFSPRSPLRYHSYRMRGDYCKQLDTLFAMFPRPQVLLLESAELRRDPGSCVHRAWRFLGLPSADTDGTFAPRFVGTYPRPHPLHPERLLLRFLMRRPVRELQRRYGIRFRHEGKASAL
jgi:hypothetical protein